MITMIACRNFLYSQAIAAATTSGAPNAATAMTAQNDSKKVLYATVAGVAVSSFVVRACVEYLYYDELEGSRFILS